MPPRGPRASARGKRPKNDHEMDVEESLDVVPRGGPANKRSGADAESDEKVAHPSSSDLKEADGANSAASGSESEVEGSSEASVSEGSDGSEDGSGDDSDSSDGNPRREKKRRAFVVPPPREKLPQRMSRANRYQQGDVVEEEGDTEFWNQEFFAEEENDSHYETESEPEDRFDRDFMDEESEDDDEDGAKAEATAQLQERKKKALRPPGASRPRPLPSGRPPVPPRPSSGSRPSAAPSAAPRQVRDSTRHKVQDSEAERRQAELQRAKRPASRPSGQRLLTQAELLAEAARTEIENARSLQHLEAIEEENKRRGEGTRVRYAGPMLRWCSSAKQSGEKECDGDDARRDAKELPSAGGEAKKCAASRSSTALEKVESSTLEVRNMPCPPELLSRQAPPPAPRLRCVITGLPARYRDPRTRLPFAHAAAAAELRRRAALGLPLVGGAG